jgi:hypothetical protein
MGRKLPQRSFRQRKAGKLIKSDLLSVFVKKIVRCACCVLVLIDNEELIIDNKK